MSDDQQRTAEGLDPDEIGDDPTDNLSYPPDEPLGVDDPTQDDRVEDSVASRAEREVPDFGESADPMDEGTRLVAPNDVLADDEASAVADSIEVDTDDLTAEEAAIHPID